MNESTRTLTLTPSVALIDSGTGPVDWESTISGLVARIRTVWPNVVVTMAIDNDIPDVAAIVAGLPVDAIDLILYLMGGDVDAVLDEREDVTNDRYVQDRKRWTKCFLRDRSLTGRAQSPE